MLARQRTSRRLTLTLIAGLAAAVIPLTFCAYEIAALRASSDAVDRTRAQLDQARAGSVALSHALVSFTALAIDVDEADRRHIIETSGDQLTSLRQTVETIRQSADIVLDNNEIANLGEAVEQLLHSWEEVRHHETRMEQAEKAFHFLQIHEAHKTASELDRKSTRLNSSH